MGTPYLSEVRVFSFAFAPKGWAQCNGQILPINQNQALFALLGTTYGGNGQTTFALPNLRGRVAIGMGNGHVLGEQGGEIAHTVQINEMPAHSHQVNSSMGVASTNDPTQGLFATPNVPRGNTLYSPTTNSAAPLLTNAGSGQPHSNMMPSSVLNFCIALQGIFPSRN